MSNGKLLIIGIHGLANKPPKDTLSEWWQKSIREGLKKNCKIDDADFDFELVYWASLLYRHPLHSEDDFSFDRLFNEEPYREAAEGDLKTHDDGLLDAARQALLGTGGDFLDAIKSHFSVNFATDWVLEKTLKDLDFYYDEKRQLRDPATGMKSVARSVLMGTLERVLEAHQQRRLLLIAHSMGSIIAYDVLRNVGEREPPIIVDHFVTIGSPLGMPYVKQNVQEERKHRPGEAVRTPTVVAKSWVNFADRADPVALDTHLSDDFAANAALVVVRDDLVDNDYVGLDGKRNHHKSYGYLRTPELSEHIKTCL